MHTIKIRNINHAIPKAIKLFHEHGVGRQSRYGDVLVMPEPVTTMYEQPTERVLFDPFRDANPFFHLFESLWMLDGRQDVETIAQWLPGMREFSDDGVTFHGAYGHRWRCHFPHDQLELVIGKLKLNPLDRRVMIQMYDASTDAMYTGKDVPCNTMIKLAVVHGCLDMMVFNRSNDMVLGAYGANAVHMSVLQEYLATNIGFPVGRYWQISCDFHIYKKHWNAKRWDLDRSDGPWGDPYTLGGVSVKPLIRDPDLWDQECTAFVDGHCGQVFEEPFFNEVVLPMYYAHVEWRETPESEERYTRALSMLNWDQAGAVNVDWIAASIEWLLRRYSRWQGKQ